MEDRPGPRNFQYFSIIALALSKGVTTLFIAQHIERLQKWGL